MVLVLAVLGFLAVKIIPVYMDKINFEDDVTRIVNKAGAENWADQPIRTQIMRTARTLDFELNQNDIRIERAGRFQSASRLRVGIKFRRPVRFPGYGYVFEFDTEFEALIGRL